MSETEMKQGTQGHGDAQQIDVGTYQLLIGQTVVGELFVEEDPAHPNDSKHRIEHWCLYSSFVTPSAANPVVTLQFKRLSGQYGSEADFRLHIKNIQGARYIKAPCREMTP